MNIKDIKTPAYVCIKQNLVKNLELLRYVGDKSGAKVLCALKGFAFSLGMEFVDKYLDGATCSGLHECKFANEFIREGEIHTYSPAFKDEDFKKIVKKTDHIIFNSCSQFQKFYKSALKHGVSCGIRVNLEVSIAPTDSYNPCGKNSRLGVTRDAFNSFFDKNLELLNVVDGLHFHALCEESADSLEIVLSEFEKRFAKFIPKLKWVNFGGGHHITKDGYNVDKLISIIVEFRKKYNVDVYIEPGEAVGWECGYLLSTVLDIVNNGENIAILDISCEAHMPDTVLMPYRPRVQNEKDNGKFRYLLGGNTCLAGDIVGKHAGNEVYRFDKELVIGDRIIFEDQIHYTIVKNTTFNGIKLPDLVLADKNGEVIKIKKFDYKEYKRRN